MKQFFANQDQGGGSESQQQQQLNAEIFAKIYDVLVRVEKHLLKYGPKKEDGKKRLLND